MNAVTHLEKVIVGEVSAVTHLEKVIAGETSAVTYTEKVITGEATPITHLQRVIAGVESPVTHLEYVWAGSSPTPTEHEYTGVVPYSFNADGEPLLDWYIKGNTVQNGTPTPTDPIQPQECGERTGNLYFKKLAGANISDGGVIATITGFDLYIAEVEQGVQYSGNGYIYAFFEDVPAIGSITFNNSRVVESFKNIVSPINGFVAVRNPNTIQNAMCNTGNTILPYEPYGYKIPISSANTTTPVYLGEVETTRKIKKLVFDGSEGWLKYSGTSGSYLYYLGGLSKSEVANCICTHVEYSSIVPNSNIQGVQMSDSKSTLLLNCGSEVITENTVTAFKEYLAQQHAAGTPVTVWYVLATPTTGIVNEPLRKIGDYADEVSNVATIPTVNGSNTIDVETAVKPSEVYIKYKGV